MSQFFKDNRPLLFTTFISLLLIPIAWKYAMLSDVPKLEKSREEILKYAKDYAERVGFNTNGFDEAIIPAQLQSPSHTTALKANHTQLEMRRLIEQKEVDIPIWKVIWTKDVSIQSSQESMEILFTASGDVLSMERQYYDTASIAPIPIDSAKVLAIAFLEREHGLNVRDTSRFTFISAKSDERKSFTIQSFVWYDEHRAGEIGVKKVSVGFVGSMIKSFSNEMLISEAAKEEAFQNAAALFGSRGFLTTLLVFVTLILLAVVFLKKYHEGEVGVRGGTVLFAVVFMLGTLAFLNAAGTSSVYVSFGLSRSLNYIFFLFFGIVFGQLLLAGTAFFAWTIGESDARFNKREMQILGIDALLQKKFFSKAVGREVLVGAAFGIVVCALAIATIALGNHFFGTWSGTAGVAVSESILPFSPFWELGTVVSANVLIRLFLFERILKKLKKKWLAIGITGLAWAVYYHYFPPVYPFWASFAGSLVIGIVLSAFSAKRGLLAVITAEFVYQFLFSNIPLLLAPSAEFWGAGVADLSLLAVVGVAAVFALQRGEEFSFKGSVLPSHVQRISQRARMEEELKIARETQLRLLPQHDPTVRGLDVSGICLPALEVGGDYYDYMKLPNGKFAVAIGDVSGKGVPAAMYMTLVKGVIQFASGVIAEPKQVLTETNRLVFQSFKRGTFVSMIYAIIDVKEKNLRYARAGHNPLLLVSRSTGASSAPMPKGMALGLADSQVFEKTLEETTASLQSGDTLVFYTDGFSEAKNEEGEEYGEERLLKALASFASKPTSREVVQAICKDVQRFTGFAPQYDDMTMVVVKIL
ncbi:MAG: SpoIIE family protein phosphatase [Chloroherpetonaceae bacterium]